MPTPDIVVLPNTEMLALRAAADFAAAAAAAIADRGRFHIALAGGSTPEKTYQLLATPVFAARIDWENVHFFVGDERIVSYDDPRSNYGMAGRALLSHMPIPPANLHPIPVDMTPAENASEYEVELRRVLGRDLRLDLVLLGLGDDGHTASLFPGMPSLDVRDHLAVATPHGVLPPPVGRVTLTYPMLNAARAVVFLVAGAGKAEAVRDILQGGFPLAERPAAGVQLVDGTVTWLLDRAAAALLDL